MIDIDRETLLTMSEAARAINPDRPPHITTLWRWKTKGIRGRVLESVTIGGRTYTSREALQRFADHRGGPSPVSTLRSPKARERAISRAERELEDAGV